MATKKKRSKKKKVNSMAPLAPVIPANQLVPYSNNTQPENVQFQTKEALDIYPEAGTHYAGYYRLQNQNYGYQRIKQRKKNYTINIRGGVYDDGVSVAVNRAFTFHCSSIIICYNLTAARRLGIYDDDSPTFAETNLKGRVWINGTGNVIIPYETSTTFSSSSVITALVESGAAITYPGEEIRIILVGWEESNVDL